MLRTTSFICLLSVVPKVLSLFVHPTSLVPRAVPRRNVLLLVLGMEERKEEEEGKEEEREGGRK